MAAAIYLDNNATTPQDPAVTAEMLPFFERHYGNPASRTHSFGWFAEESVKIARERAAALIEAAADDLIFTSGATESNNLAVLGAAAALGSELRSAVFVSDQIEHRSVIDPLEHLAAQGTAVRFCPVTADGLIDPEQFAGLLTPEVRLVSLMLGNNEIGTLFDIPSLAGICRSKAPAALIHCDATQAAGKVPVAVGALGVDLLSFSAHKIYGPKGIGAFWIGPKAASRVKPLIFGGGHERGFRSGTLNVPAIAGFGKACELAKTALPTEPGRLNALTRQLLDLLQAKLGEFGINGSAKQRLPGNLNLQIPGVDSATFLPKIGTKLALSAGSACTSGRPGGSFVLRALGLPPEAIAQSLRIGIGRFTTPDEIDRTATILVHAITMARNSKGLYQP